MCSKRKQMWGNKHWKSVCGKVENTPRVDVPSLVLLWKHDSRTVRQHSTGNSSNLNEVTQIKFTFSSLPTTFCRFVIHKNNRWRSFSFYRHLNTECYELSAVNWMGGGARNGVTGGRVCPWVEKQIYTSLIMIFIVQTIDVVHMLVLIAEVFLQLRKSHKHVLYNNNYEQLMLQSYWSLYDLN